MTVATEFNYKMDFRTEKEFIEDLTRGLENEAKVIQKFRNILKNSDIENPEVVFVGSEAEGTVSYDENNKVADVDVFPDYLLKYKEKRRIRFDFIEVKVCNPHSADVYFKVKQLEQYRELGNVSILFVMGFKTRYPMFVLVKPDDILNLGIKPTIVYGKETIVMNAQYFNWETLDILDRDYNLIKKDYIRRSLLTK